jgi:NAD-dependent SIR2 family protein deacetylase
MEPKVSGGGSENSVASWISGISGLISCAIALFLLIGGIILWFNNKLEDVKKEAYTKQEQMIVGLRGEIDKKYNKLDVNIDRLYIESKRHDDSISKINGSLDVTKTELCHAKEKISENKSEIKLLVEKNDRNKDEILVLKQNSIHQIRAKYPEIMHNNTEIAHNKYPPIEKYQNPSEYSKLAEYNYQINELTIVTQSSDVIAQKEDSISDSMQERNKITGVSPILEKPKITGDTAVPPVSLDSDNVPIDNFATNHISSFQYIVSWDQFNNGISDIDIVETLIRQHISTGPTLNGASIDNIRSAICICLEGWSALEGLYSNTTTITDNAIEFKITIDINVIAIQIVVKTPQLAAVQKDTPAKK